LGGTDGTIGPARLDQELEKNLPKTAPKIFPQSLGQLPEGKGNCPADVMGVLYSIMPNQVCAKLC
jgi:hypothetical protein